MDARIFYTVLLYTFIAGTFAIITYDVKMLEGDSGIIELKKPSDSRYNYRFKCDDDDENATSITDDECRKPHLTLHRINNLHRLTIEKINFEYRGVYELQLVNWLEFGGFDIIERVDVNIDVYKCECDSELYPETYKIILKCDLPSDVTDVLWAKNNDILTRSGEMESVIRNYKYGQYNYRKRVSLVVNPTFLNSTDMYKLYWKRINRSIGSTIKYEYDEFDPIVNLVNRVTKNLTGEFIMNCNDRRVMFRHLDRTDVWTSKLLINSTLRIPSITSKDYGIYACPEDRFSNMVILTFRSISPILNTCKKCIEIGWIFVIMIVYSVVIGIGYVTYIYRDRIMPLFNRMGNLFVRS